MKNTIKLLAAGTLLSSNSAFGAIVLTNGTNVALGTTGITYTVTGITEDNGNGDLGVNLGGTGNATVTIVFSSAVDFTIAPTSTRFGNVFDYPDGANPVPVASTFTTNGSNWNYTAATQGLQLITNNLGSSFEITQERGAANSASDLDWGNLVSTGVTSITWDVDFAAREVVKFCADAPAIPEPTSTTFLASCLGLTLLRRRRA